MANRTADSDAPAPGRTRRNRGSEIVRGALVEAAIAEFASHGFEGASTRRIAEAAGAHQSQIAYHFDTKDELWRRCLERLLGEVDAAVADAAREERADGRVHVIEAVIRGLVRFGAARPELNRIMMHEATSPSDRLTWLVETQVGHRREAVLRARRELQDAGLASPAITDETLYHTVIGAASLLYANAPEAQLLGIDPSDPELVERHADGLVALFLPGLAGPRT